MKDRSGSERSSSAHLSGPVSGRAATTLVAEDLVTSVFGLLIVTAVYLDGRAHVLGLPDSFFTPWHAFLYGGLLLLVGWLALLGRRAAARQRVARLAVIPAGYGHAVAGAAVFGAGGVSDMVWHQLFGVEFGIDALLSPTHLVLFAGGALLFSGPIRASRLRAGSSSRLMGLPAMFAVTAITAVAAFALSYLSGFMADQATMAVSHAPEGTAEHIAGEAIASAGLASYLVTSLVIVVPLALLIRFGLAVPGTVTFLVTSLALLASVLADFPNPGVIIAAAAAGAVADLALAGLGGLGASVRVRELVMAPLLPLLLWPGQLVAVAAAERVLWSLEMVTGVVIVSAGVSFAAVFVLGMTSSNVAKSPEKAVRARTRWHRTSGAL